MRGICIGCWKMIERRGAQKLGDWALCNECYDKGYRLTMDGRNKVYIGKGEMPWISCRYRFSHPAPFGDLPGLEKSTAAYPVESTTVTP